MNRDAFWERVNAALDARRDPLEDPQVQRALELEPERLDELLQVDSALATLAAPKRRRRIAIAAAMVTVSSAAAGLALLLIATSPDEPGVDAEADSRSSISAAPFALSPCLGLLELRVTHTVASHDTQRTTHVDVLASRTELELLRSEPTGHWTSFSFATLHSLPHSR